MSTIFVNNIQASTGNQVVIPAGHSLQLGGTTLDAASLMPNPSGQGGLGVASDGSAYVFNSYGAKGIVTFTSNSTYFPSSGTKLVYVRVVAAGGGGSGYAECGGAGGFSEGFFSMVGVASVGITVGTGGGPTYYSGGAGSGTASSFGTYISCTGGNGANSNHQHCGGLPGLGSGGQVNLYGGGGTGHGHNGRGGASHFGGSNGNGHPQGGAYAPNHQTHGSYGGGGANGWGGSYTGAKGMGGCVVVMEYG